MPRTPVRQRAGRRLWSTPADLTCGRCRQPIPGGQEHHRDVSGQAHHPSCVRLRITPAVAPPPAPQVVRLVQADARRCTGCGDLLGDQRAVSVSGAWWHHACRVLLR